MFGGFCTVNTTANIVITDVYFYSKGLSCKFLFIEPFLFQRAECNLNLDLYKIVLCFQILKGIPNHFVSLQYYEQYQAIPIQHKNYVYLFFQPSIQHSGLGPKFYQFCNYVFLNQIFIEFGLF